MRSSFDVNKIKQNKTVKDYLQMVYGKASGRLIKTVIYMPEQGCLCQMLG